LSGKNRYHVFDAEQDSSLRDHHESLERIRRALREREFVLHYQPKVNMRSGAVIGAEALIRWQHPQYGLLAPARFLPVIEDHPLAIDVGEWVIDTALGQIALWRAQGLKLPVSVNVGARQLQQADFVARLRVLLAAHPDVDPRDLQLEVLETSALEDLVVAARVIDRCRELGVTCALDDFGTGYSSLSYLKRLPVTLLKIDRSFVRDMLEDPDDLAILEGVIGLARAFRRGVIVEGVETVRQGELLLSLDCELAQGFGIARPMAAADLPGWAAAWRPAASWAERPALPPMDLPLLFARIEHEAWIAALEALLTGARDDLVVNHRQCRYGAWLATEARVRHGAKPAFQAIERLHGELHLLAEELCQLAVTGRKAEAAARLGELHALRDAAIQQVDALLHDMRR
jgi:EAL domain-containing protein (putative c-di-GMP-specific phosphodiesterase class I)